MELHRLNQSVHLGCSPVYWRHRTQEHIPVGVFSCMTCIRDVWKVLCMCKCMLERRWARKDTTMLVSFHVRHASVIGSLEKRRVSSKRGSVVVERSLPLENRDRAEHRRVSIVWRLERCRSWKESSVCSEDPASRISSERGSVVVKCRPLLEKLRQRAGWEWEPSVSHFERGRGGVLWPVSLEVYERQWTRKRTHRGWFLCPTCFWNKFSIIYIQ